MTNGFISAFIATCLILIGTQVQAMDGSASSQHAYGVDCSFPIHSTALKCGSLLGDRQSAYEEFMAGCRLKYKEDCDSHEEIRMATALRQPTTAMNHTVEGFKVIEAPAIVKEQLSEYWKNNKHRMKEERWPKGATAVNHWAAPTYIVKAEDKGLRGGGAQLEEVVQEATKRSLEQWTHMEMRPAAVHGIRVHTEGAIIPPHVGRAPLMHSAIVNVAQSLDENWVLELYKRDGSAVNITLEPGSMLLFESSSLIYGHPFPLRGRYFASYYLHFYPGGWISDDFDDTEGEEHHDFELSNSGIAESETIQSNMSKDTLNELDSPTTIQDTFPKKMPGEATESRPLEPHIVAASGDVVKFVKLMKNKENLTLKDQNGWEPIHEAARWGQLQILEILIVHGVNINQASNFGSGESPLRIAMDHLKEGHPVLAYLKLHGAVAFGPEL